MPVGAAAATLSAITPDMSSHGAVDWCNDHRWTRMGRLQKALKR